MWKPTLLLLACSITSANAAPQLCDGLPLAHDYSSVLDPERRVGTQFSDLPGFTRSVYAPDHALVTAESRVWGPNPAWRNTVTAHIISRASGANFAMYLAEMKAGGEALAPAPGVQRLAIVLNGAVQLEAGGETVYLNMNDYIYLPANDTSKLTSADGAGLVVYEKIYAISNGKAELHHGHIEDRPNLDTPGEVFALRKLLPATDDYDFNVHIMDFKPGQHLNVKEIHYNQHGLLLLEGKGIYRLADKWYSVTAGDAIWMAPYVVQWYAALGTQASRYALYKDTTIDPLFYPGY